MINPPPHGFPHFAAKAADVTSTVALNGASGRHLVAHLTEALRRAVEIAPAAAQFSTPRSSQFPAETLANGPGTWEGVEFGASLI